VRINAARLLAGAAEAHPGLRTIFGAELSLGLSKPQNGEPDPEGTHLVVLSGSVEVGTEAPFDLMVDDLEATHADWAGRGFEVSPIESGRIHSAFTVRDPDGYVVTVNSSHVMGEV